MSVVHVYETKWPTASMPDGDVGQINFSANGQHFSLLMSRTDFDRLEKRMRALLREIPPLVHQRGSTLSSNKDELRDFSRSPTSKTRR
jgi:hypothetical protein